MTMTIEQLLDELDIRLSKLRLEKTIGDRMWGEGTHGIDADLLFFTELKAAIESKGLTSPT